MMSTSIAIAGAALAGLVIHLSLFIRGEWERHTPAIAAIHFLFSSALFLLLTVVRQLSARDSFVVLSMLSTAYLGTLFMSICIYRYYFHPLKHFPGTTASKLTGFWSVFLSVKEFKLHTEVQQLHEQFGDFVRIRPREISVSNADAIRDIHGPGTVCLKGPFYDINYPSRSLQMTRDKSFHSKRRRIWDRGFSTKALNEYEPRVQRYCRDLISQISSHAGKPVDVTSWFNFFGFDVMGDLSFGKSFNMLKEGSAHFILDNMIATKPIIGALVCIPWVFVLFQSMPIIRSKRIDWVAWCGRQVEERKKMGKSRNDLFSYILDSDENSRTSKPSGDLVFDSELAIIAGSETTAVTLTTILYLLVLNPENKKLLQEEIDGSFSSVDNISHQKLAGQPILDGCIQEAMRLYPAVPSGVQRLTPPQGATIAGTWIPGDTIVSTPTYSIHRDPRYFVEPNTFIPERWSTKPHMILRKDAFNAFSTGKFACAGRPLAMMEMRMTIALLVRTLDFNFPKDNNNIQRNEHHQIRELFDGSGGFQDYFTAKVPDLPLVFSKRS